MHPRWRGDGRELLCRSLDLESNADPVETSPKFSAPLGVIRNRREALRTDEKTR